MKNLNGILLLSLVLGMAASLHAQEAGKSGYKILQSVPLPGDGGYDFLTVDSDARRVYITHNNSVQVVDADALTLLGTVENVPHPHGVAFLPDLGKGYASSGQPGSVVVFDLNADQWGFTYALDLHLAGRCRTPAAPVAFKSVAAVAVGPKRVLYAGE